MAEQTWLCLTWSEALKIGFLLYEGSYDKEPGDILFNQHYLVMRKSILVTSVQSCSCTYASSQISFCYMKHQCNFVVNTIYTDCKTVPEISVR